MVSIAMHTTYVLYWIYYITFMISVINDNKTLWVKYAGCLFAPFYEETHQVLNFRQLHPYPRLEIKEEEKRNITIIN